jgi:hypothetical protein
MDGQRFDSAARVLADTTNRRGLLRGGLGALLLALGLGKAHGAAAQTTTAGLAEAINAYRQAQGLAAIPVSDELTRVAKAHIADLAAHHPEVACNGNLHSWSSNGNWTSGCYDPNNQATYPLMWNKPKEIAGYQGNGYEISAWRSPSIDADQALDIWKGSKGHNDVILNLDIWAGFPWGAMGGWLADGYACVWFGQEAGTPPVTEPMPPVIPPGEGEATGCPWGPNQCKQGYVWRVSTPEDLVCVTPEMREQVAADNALAAERQDGDGCIEGYVHRLTTPDDLVCVTQEMQDQVAEDNAAAEERKDPACAEADDAVMADAEDEADGEDEADDTEDDADTDDTGEERPDTDGDGLYDDDETDVYFTEPDNPDTDGDDIEDGQEVFDGTDPNDPNDPGDGAAPEDADDDGSTDDSVTDRPDTDGDGLFDDDETDVYFTEPDNPDTDGDNVDDGQEVFDGTDPNDPEDFLEQ